MLALSRKPGESVVIGNDIEITILEVKGEQVKVGIKAPQSVAIYRKELFEQIQESNREASKISEDVMKNLNKIFEQKNKGLSFLNILPIRIIESVIYV